MPKIKRALLSVSNKKGIVDFARGLTDLGIEILSTGGTARALEKAQIPVKEVSQYTQSPSMLGGRVKTLHPRIHGALLALRDDPHQMKEVKEHSLELIDMVVVNLYPFFDVIQKEGVILEEAIENIDIGGPTMLRSAAKNFPFVAAVSSPDQYPQVLKELKENDCSISEETCLSLATRVFQEVSTYNSFIANYLAKNKKQKFPEILNLSFKKQIELRYGENPHQKAAFYGEWEKEEASLSSAQKIWGKKDLSFNNLLDIDAALNIVREFKEPTAVVIKHTNPCGVGSASSLDEAFRKAYSGDPLSAFGSIVGLNKVVNSSVAEKIASPGTFIEVIIAPDYEEEALEILKTRQKWGKNVRILKTGNFELTSSPFPLPYGERGSDAIYRILEGEKKKSLNIKKVTGGILLQEEDEKIYIPSDLKTVTQREPTQKEKDDLLFAWIVAKWVKSNAIVLAKDKTVVGVGAGQMSRIDACLLAIRKADRRVKDAVLASDALIPFPDVVEEAGKNGITALIQPGGALRDKEVIEAADKYGIAMLFTGMRHFRH